jgi:DNA replication protein DnaC
MNNTSKIIQMTIPSDSIEKCKSEEINEDRLSKFSWRARENFMAWLNQLSDQKKQTRFEDCKNLPEGLIEHGKKWSKSYPIRSQYLWGTFGSGKTTFACAMIREFLEGLGGKFEMNPHFLTAKTLDNKLINDRNAYGTDASVILMYSECDLLFIDDLDKFNATERVKSQFFEILNNRYENNLPMIITSNLSPLQLTNILGAAISDRIKDKKFWDRIEFPDRNLRTM